MGVLTELGLNVLRRQFFEPGPARPAPARCRQASILLGSNAFSSNLNQLPFAADFFYFAGRGDSHSDHPMGYVMKRYVMGSRKTRFRTRISRDSG